MRLLKVKDLAELCKLDEQLIHKRIAQKAAKGKTAVAIVPDTVTLEWHHAREDFVGTELYGKTPEIKGAMVELDNAGKRAWCVWTRMWYNSDPQQSKDNALHILRLAIDDDEHTDYEEASEGGTEQVKGSKIVAAIAALLAAAQTQASEWNMGEVDIWLVHEQGRRRGEHSQLTRVGTRLRRLWQRRVCWTLRSRLSTAKRTASRVLDGTERDRKIRSRTWNGSATRNMGGVERTVFSADKGTPFFRNILSLEHIPPQRVRETEGASESTSRFIVNSDQLASQSIDQLLAIVLFPFSHASGESSHNSRIDDQANSEGATYKKPYAVAIDRSTSSRKTVVIPVVRVSSFPREGSRRGHSFLGKAFSTLNSQTSKASSSKKDYKI